MPSLSEKHLGLLRAAAISDEVIEARGYRTIQSPEELRSFGFSAAQCRVPGLLLPLHGTDGSNGYYVYRPDNPRVIEQKNKPKLPDGTFPNQVLKYEVPKGAGVRVDCPPLCRPKLADPSIPLLITEGQKKADALASAGQCAIALLGVWNFKGKNEFGGTTFLADFDHIPLDGRNVRIVFDSDIRTNPNVRSAMERLREHLQRKKAHVSVVYLPPASDGSKQGVDDFLASGQTIQDLERFLEAPRELPKPAAPVYELLDEEPLEMRRPLALVNGIGYAATWVRVKVTLTESVNKKDEIVRHNPPLVTTEQRLIIVRQDGHTFGDGGDASMDELGFAVNLKEIPPAEKLWSTRALKQFRNGYRPKPAELFECVVDIVDRFIDFDHSLASQRTMSELAGCYVLMTYLLDAFTVVGYIYPNGDRGSGKTQLIQVICELAYLGMVILAGGSYATLRDMADYGATLAFDDAEGLSDPKRTDPDKRNLLLAGNRRGNTVSVKELVGDRWQTRYVNTFCPRLFSATRFPDPILASRTIIVPLIRTPDRERANSDPLDYRLWEFDRRVLVDDLWALGVAHLHELPAYETRVNETGRLTGRNLEPWRAVLAVALWLDDNGVSGLWNRLEQLSWEYQSERPTLEMPDLTTLIIQALRDYVGNVIHDINDVNDVNDVQPRTVTIATKKLVELVKELVETTEADVDLDHITARNIGRLMSKMRMKCSRTTKTRQWDVPLLDLVRLCKSYSIDVSEKFVQRVAGSEITPLSVDVTNVIDVMTSSGGRDVSDANDIIDVLPEREVFDL